MPYISKEGLVGSQGRGITKIFNSKIFSFNTYLGAKETNVGYRTLLICEISRMNSCPCIVSDLFPFDCQKGREITEKWVPILGTLPLPEN